MARVCSARDGRGVRVTKRRTENGVRVTRLMIIQRPKMMMIMLRDIINLPFSSFLAYFWYIVGLISCFVAHTSTAHHSMASSNIVTVICTFPPFLALSRYDLHRRVLFFDSVSKGESP